MSLYIAIDRDLVIFEGRDMYVGVDEDNLNVNGVVAASYVP